MKEVWEAYPLPSQERIISLSSSNFFSREEGRSPLRIIPYLEEKKRGKTILSRGKSYPLLF